MNTEWYDRPIDTRAKAGGEVGVDGKERKGGEFEPFYVPRTEMPQIDQKDYKALIAFANRKGVTISLGVFQPEDLKHHQRVDDSKLKATIKAEPIAEEIEKASEPVLVSKDFYVLDGNHRLDSHKLQGTPVIAFVIELGFEEAIDFLFSFPKTSISTVIN